MDKITALVGAVLGLGGGLGLTGIVLAVRAWKRGDIEDDDKIIVRLNADSKTQRTRANELEAERDEKARLANLLMEQAVRYRLQIIALGGTPMDMEVMRKELL
jgi:hypothetical protein